MNRADSAREPASREPASRPPARSAGAHVARTLRLAVPLMLGRAGVLLMVAIDTVMIGRVAADEVAFYGMGGVPFLFFLIFGVGVLTGAVPLVAQAAGAGRMQDCGRIWLLAMATGFLFGLLGMAILSQAETLLLMAGQQALLAAGAARVSWQLALGLPFLLMHYASASFMEALGRPLPGMVFMAIANILNAALNWLLMFGIPGIEANGASAAALATTIVRVFLFVGLSTFILVSLDHAAYGIGRIGPRGPADWMKLLKTGLPFGVAQGIETSSFQAVAIFAGWLGTLPMAAYTAVVNLVAMFYMLSSGLAVATSIRVANAVGRNDDDGMREAAATGFRMTLVLTVVLAFLLWLAPAPFARFYLGEPQAARLMASVLWVVGLVVIFDGTQVMLMSVLRGASDRWVPTGLHLVACALVLAPSAWLLAIVAGLGLHGLLAGMATGLFAATCLLGRRKSRILALGARQL
ncbi:MAG: MATE family efflux transporter [Geminicoccaceae bacterium]